MEVVKEVLEKYVGKQAVSSIFYYTGEPNSDSFEENLNRIFGPGSVLIMNEVRSRLVKPSSTKFDLSPKLGNFSGVEP